MAAVNNFIYVLTNKKSLHVLNLENPANPVEVGAYNYGPPGADSHMVIAGNYAYIPADCVTDCAGLRIVDISHPTTPYNGPQKLDRKKGK
jgi:hypothetical protein